MSERIKYSDEPIEAEVIADFLPAPEEMYAKPDPEAERAWLEEVRRRSAELDAGRMKSLPAEEVFERVRSGLKK